MTLGFCLGGCGRIVVDGEMSKDIVERHVIEPCRRCSEMVVFDVDGKGITIVTNVIDGEAHPCIDP